jgi:hypothetical protein
MKTRNTIAALIIAMSASLLVSIISSGCGQSSTPSTTTAPTAPSPTPTPPTPTPTPNPSCTITMNPTAQSVPLAGGVFFSQVTTSSPDCPWTASVDSSWILIASGGSGSTTGPVTYSVPENHDVTRTGTLIVRAAASSGSVSITQLGATDCQFTLSPSAQSVDASGGGFQFTVTRNTVNGCSWSATTATPWITLTGPTSGLSPASIKYSVGANTTATDRTGAISLIWHGGSADFVVAQSGH